MKNYGCLSFIFDSTLVLVTCGLWLIWIFIREMRRKNKINVQQVAL